MTAIASISPAQTINTLPPATQAALDGLMADTILAGVFPAAAVTAVYDGEVRLNAAWGVIDPDAGRYPVQPDTLFDLASITKVFTVTALLSLMRSHNLGLDMALALVVPEFAEGGPRPIDGGQDPHSKLQLPTPPGSEGRTVNPMCVRLRDVITHTSGIAPWRDVFNAAGPVPAPPDQPDPVTRAERWSNALAALCGYPFVSEPDGVVRYSDVGLMLLGEAVSRLNGTPRELDKAVAARVLQPLGMESTLYNPVRNGRDRNGIAPTEYDPDWRRRRVWGEVHDENACGVGGVAGHAGLFSTARDVALLGQAWLDDDPRLSIPVAIMDSARRENARNGFRFGLGWMLKAEHGSSAGDLFSAASYGHTGFTGTSLWVDPERRLVVACLTNSVYPGRARGGTHAFRRALHDLLAAGR